MASFHNVLRQGARLGTLHSRGSHLPFGLAQRVILPKRLSSTSAAAAEIASPSPRESAKLIVFGARGFVGSHVCQEALSSGLQVVGVSRSGTPPVIREPWTDEVEWVRGNALEPQTYQHLLEGASAAISCIGGFGNQEEMLRINGTANTTLVQTAKAAGVKRFVFISAAIPNVPGIDMALGGYIRGKAMTEAAIRESFPETGVFLQPGVIYGNRVVSSSLTLPLQFLFQPVEKAISFIPDGGKQLAGLPLVGALFVPPVSAASVARAAVRAATDPSVPPGAMDVYTIQQYK